MLIWLQTSLTTDSYKTTKGTKAGAHKAVPRTSELRTAWLCVTVNCPLNCYSSSSMLPRWPCCCHSCVVNLKTTNETKCPTSALKEAGDVADKDDDCVPDGGGEETVPRNWETSARFQQRGVYAGGVELEERVSPHVHLYDLSYLSYLTSFESLFLAAEKEMRSTTSWGAWEPLWTGAGPVSPWIQ